MLGVSLLQRDGRSLALTSHGREYLEQIAPILAQLAAVPLHRRQVQRQQRLTLRMPPTFARQILIPRLASFAEACPEIQLEILLSSPRTARTCRWPMSRCAATAMGVAAGERLLEERVLPMAAPGCCSACRGPGRQPCSPACRCCARRWSPGSRGSAWPGWTGRARAGPRLLDLGMTLEAAANGQGVALAPSLGARLACPGAAGGAVLPLRSAPTHHYHLRSHQASPASQRLPPGWRRCAARRWSRAGNSFRRRTTKNGGISFLPDADTDSACGGTSRLYHPSHRRSGLHERHRRYRRPAPPGRASACRGCSTTTPTPVPGAKAPTAPTRSDFAAIKLRQRVARKIQNRSLRTRTPRPGDGHAGGHRAHRAGRHAGVPTARSSPPAPPPSFGVRYTLSTMTSVPWRTCHGSRPAVLVASST